MGYATYITELNCTFCLHKGRYRFNSLARKTTCPNCPNKIDVNWPRPDFPNCVYIGADRLKRIKILPLPRMYATDEYRFGRSDPPVQPYSIRSFLCQLSELNELPYTYRCELKGEDEFGNEIRTDHCVEWDEQGNDTRRVCSIATGWTTGEATCPGWQRIVKLCQSQPEYDFLHEYLRLVKDLEFPMLLPQARLNWEESRRPDFVAFVPKTYSEWRKFAFQIDPTGTHQDKEADRVRDLEIQSEGYEVVKFNPNIERRTDMVKRLIKSMRALMEEADRV